MDDPVPRIAFIGFGEAAATFARDLRTPMSGYDLLLGADQAARAKRAEMATAGVVAAAGNAEAAAGADIVLSLVTADQCERAAFAAVAGLAPGTLYCDMNSVSPDTKRRACALVEAAGGHYADVAIMAPVRPAGLAVPLLVSGRNAGAAAAALAGLGFAPRALAGGVGAASAVKMARSVMVKGMEALAAEFILAAEAAGVRVEALASLDASEPAVGWAARCNDGLERMLVHGARRAAEMTEAASMLDALGTGSAMTRGTIERQLALGGSHRPVPETLAGKLAVLLAHPGGPA